MLLFLRAETEAESSNQAIDIVKYNSSSIYLISIVLCKLHMLIASLALSVSEYNVDDCWIVEKRRLYRSSKYVYLIMLTCCIFNSINKR